MAGRRSVERLKFWSGQLLASGDLRALVESSAERRAAHNRAVHRAYGVAIGLAVDPPKDGAVRVSCGLAYDCAGREILVLAPADVPLATDPARTLLVVAHADRGSRFAWFAPRQFNWRAGVALADLKDPGFVRAVSRPLAQPKIATGRTVPGATSWQPWSLVLADDTIDIGVQTRIDTTAAGFTTPPRYFPTVRATSADALNTWFTSVADETAQSFTTRLFFRRIARQRLQIAAPRAFLTADPKVGTKIKVDNAASFAANDTIVRLTPVAELRSTIDAIAGNVVSLADAMTLAAPAVAFGHGARAATVSSVVAKPQMDVGFDDPTPFQANDVMVRLTMPIGDAPPAVVDSVAAGGETVRLRTPIPQLAPGESVGRAQFASLVQRPDGANVEVADSSGFHVDDVVVRIADDADQSRAVTVLSIKGNVLELSAPIAGLVAQSQLGVVGPSIAVGAVTPKNTQIKVQFRKDHAFKADDLVVRLGDGAAAVPVRVATTDSKSITLEQVMPNLENGDTIGAASAGPRATVLAIRDRVLTLSAPAGFVMHRFVARVSDTSATSAAVRLESVIGSSCVLSAPIDGLKVGETIAVVVPASTAQVVAVEAGSRTIAIDTAGAFAPLDIVAVPGQRQLAVVTAVDGTNLQVTPMVDVAPGQVLESIAFGGVTQATEKGDAKTFEVDRPEALRPGDLLAPVVGWRDAGAPQRVRTTQSGALQIDDVLGGALKHDPIGLASVRNDAIQLRLEASADVSVGNSVLVAGLDRTTGQSVLQVARVADISADGKRIVLALEDLAARFTLRPEDLDASVLLVSGQPVKFANRLGLYVTWIACEERDARPPVCDPTPAADPCATTEEKRCC